MPVHCLALPAPLRTPLARLQLLLRILVFVCAFKTCAATPQPAAPVYDGVIRQNPDGRMEAYLRPPFNNSHASFLEIMPDGSLALAYFSGTQEGQAGVAIVLTQLPPGATEWPLAHTISQRANFSNQNPVLLSDPQSGVFHVFHSQQAADAGESDSQVWHLQSTDNGRTFTTPRPLFTQPGTFDRNRILRAWDGSLVFPIYSARGNNSDQYSAMQINPDLNGDLNRGWRNFTVQGSNYLVQPTLWWWPHPHGPQLRALFRDRRAERIYYAHSNDLGRTWSVPVPTAFPNNNAAIQVNVMHASQGRPIALVFNNSTGADANDRAPLTVALSYDGGVTWPFQRNLEPPVPQPPGQGTGDPIIEHSYPSIVQGKDGVVHVAYTWNRETVKYCAFTVEWIKGERGGAMPLNFQS
eukprot:CAMPEP_0177640960 /NCGR_PEP_ID=MMETSP0447-20121125/6819_1 /TAXON_ID=0 /ORGANISM="Stygamoeba regulata, Strain BSH-02190019" /LENGTH=409 /DNA_ID=CAMNT_0019143061 /DNA_START=1 /DNA_END=1230 /DNA_ORIENTATION=-